MTERQQHQRFLGFSAVLIVAAIVNAWLLNWTPLLILVLLGLAVQFVWVARTWNRP